METSLLWFGCGRQQKRHVAAPPPAGVRRRMKRNRQKLVGRDTANKGNSNNNDTDKGNTQNKTDRTTEPLSRTTVAAHSRAASEFPPPRSPLPEPSMTAHGMEYPALFGQVGSACPAVPLPGFW